MHILRYLPLILCCLSSACRQAQPTHPDYPETYTVEYQDDSTFHWYTHMKIKQVIPLELTDSSMLGIAKKCLMTDDKIIFQDYKQRAVYVFDRQGTFLYCIDKTGNGPGEYINLWDMILSWDKHELILTDGYKLLCYNLADGRYTRTIPLELTVPNPKRNALFTAVANPQEDQYYVWTDMAEHTLYKYEAGQFTGLTLRQGQQMNTNRFVRNYRDETLVIPDFGQFGINTTDGQKRFYMDFGSHALPAHLLPETQEDMDKLEKEKYFRFISDVWESRDGIYVNTVGPANTYYEVFINKTNGRTLHGNWDKDARLVIVHVEDNDFYALFYPYYVNDDSPLKKEVEAYIKGNDNPLLIRFEVTNL